MVAKTEKPQKVAKPKTKSLEAAPAIVLTDDRFASKRDLRNREMPFANFSDSDLSGSNFFGSRLRNARFQRSTLIGVNFTQASLVGADFEAADLTDANFSQANVSGARFVKVRGLSKDDLEVLGKRGAIIREPRRAAAAS